MDNRSKKLGRGADPRPGGSVGVAMARRARSHLMRVKSKSTAVFLRPFVIPGFDEVLPAGEYAFEAELEAPTGFSNPESWMASVLIHLRPKAKSPALAQTLTVPLRELERALARDKLSGQPLADFFLEEMLVDPMVRLVMQSEGVSETYLRRLYSGSREQRPTANVLGHDTMVTQEDSAGGGPPRGRNGRERGHACSGMKVEGHQQRGSS